MPSGRTSMPALQATDLLATLPACSGRRQNHPCRLSHECKLGDQTKDDADKEPREERSCGRSQTSLYNNARPHSALGNLTLTEYANRGGVATGGRCAMPRAPRPAQLLHRAPWAQIPPGTPNRWMKHGAQNRMTAPMACQKLCIRRVPDCRPPFDTAIIERYRRRES